LDQSAEEDPTATLRRDISQQIKLLPIREAMDTNQFLTPATEEVTDSFDSIDNIVLSQFPGPAADCDEIEDDLIEGGEEIQPLIKPTETIHHTQGLLAYLE
jgi:hypothetical protein